MILDPALSLARKSALASVGAVALTGDTVAETFERLAARGEKAERAVRVRLRLATADVRADIAENQEQVVAESKERLAGLRGVVEGGLGRLADMLNLPTQRSVLQLNDEVARLSVQIDQIRAQARRQARAVEVAQGAVEPLPGYDKLNAEHVVDQLQTLPEPKLLAVRNYEQTHGNRVTVLRAVDKLLEPKPDDKVEA
jgi:poly(hydroxyalkanoate) granule-associated protein